MNALVQLLLVAALAPLAHGAMKALRARFSGRPGPSILQSYRDYAKLWCKEAVLPEGASIITRCAPGVAFGVALTLAAALPLGGSVPPLPDVVGLIFLLAVGHFVLGVAALDTRSAFSGMAASRSMTFASLVEPALLAALLGAAALGKGTQLSSLLTLAHGPTSALAFAGFFLVMLAETARIPIDNQETHYELTMIHEGLVLEYSGWHLAFLQAAAQIRQLSFLLLGAILLSGGGVLALAGWAVVLAAAVSVVETVFAKVRLFEVPQLLATGLIFAVTSIVLRLFGAPA